MLGHFSKRMLNEVAAGWRIEIDGLNAKSISHRNEAPLEYLFEAELNRRAAKQHG